MVVVLETLSNEVLMQIFEYSDAYHLFKSFFNLNSRFNRLLKDHQLRLKLNSKSIRDNDIIDSQMWYIMVNHLTAITLIKDKHIRLFMSACKESDLLHLQSLTLRRVRINKEKASVVKYISNLKSLKNLCVQSLGDMNVLALVVLCSAALPELKSFECIHSDYDTNVIFSWHTPTNIENLTVGCNLYTLRNLLLQTPKLKYLNIKLTNYGPQESIFTDSPLPIMINLIHLKIESHFISYIHLSEIMESMPYLQSLELSGISLGKNFDNGHQLKKLFGHLQIIQLESLKCLTSASSIDTILATFDEFWSDVTCLIQYDRAYVSAFGHSK